MDNGSIIFRLHPVLESRSDTPLYDIMENPTPSDEYFTRIALGDLTEETINRFKASGKAIVLLVPSEHTRYVAIDLIADSFRKTIKAAPYLIEDTLGTDLNDTHIAIFPDKESRQAKAAIVQHHLIKEWLSDFDRAGLTVDAIYRDSDAINLPSQPGIWIESQRATVVTRSCSTALSLNNLPFYLQALPEEEYTPLPIQVTISRGNTESIKQTLSASGLDCDLLPSSKQWFPDLYSIRPNTINLAQGTYAADKSILGLQTSHKIALSTFLSCMLLAICAYLGAGLYYTQQADQLRQNQIAAYRALFPEDQRVVNVRTQIKNHLSLLSRPARSDDFSGLIYLSLDALKNNTDVSRGGVRQLQYRDSPPTLSVESLFWSAREMDSYERQLTSLGFTTNIESIAQDGQAFVGKIQISRKCNPC